MVKKFLILIVMLVFLSFSLYGCYDAFTLEQYAYVIAIGIDKGEENAIKVTFQFAISDSSGNGSTQSNKSSITTVECASIDSGITMINSYISKIINLSHCKVIVISESIAESGIGEYLNNFINNIDIRPDCNLIISKSTAYDYIKNATPILTDLTARYYEVLLKSESYTGYTSKSPIWELESISYSISPTCVAILSGLNFEDENSNSNNTLNLIDKTSNLSPGNTPITGNTISQVIGLAVFSDMKLIGELNSMESICYLLLLNQLDRCTITIPSPFSTDESIDLILKMNNSSKSQVKFVNKMPYITCNVELKASILSYPRDVDYSDSKNTKLIEEYASSYMESKILDFLYKTAKVFHSDIVSFGQQTSVMYSNMHDWKNSDWKNNYKNAFFKVNVNTSIRSASVF